MASQVALVVKNPPANAGDARDAGSIPGSGRSPGGGNGSQLQYSWLGNCIDTGAWRATVHGVAKSWTWLSDRAQIDTTLVKIKQQHSIHFNLFKLTSAKSTNMDSCFQWSNCSSTQYGGGKYGWNLSFPEAVCNLHERKAYSNKWWCFWTVVLEKTLESPLDCKADPTSPS